MENHKQMTLPVVLKGENYLLWSRTTRTVLKSRGLWEHVDDSLKVSLDKGKTTAGEEGVETSSEAGSVGSSSVAGSEQDDPKWIQEDQLVLAVLQSSLEPSILAAYSYAETAKELWDTLLGVYGNTSNLSRIFEVKKALNELQQEGKPFKSLFGEFRNLWAELEMLRPPTIDLSVIMERREQDQVFGLLLTLNGSFSGLIHHILRYEKLPTLNEVCMMIQKEEGSKGLFQGTSETAYVSQGAYQQTDRRTSWVCEHCKKAGHTKEKCWVLHPQLRLCEHCKRAGHIKEKCWVLHPHLKEKTSGQMSRGRAGVANASGDDMVRKSDLDALIKSITKLTKSGKSFLSSKPSKPIIVDSGASHHMISDPELLSNVKPHLGKVTIANGEDVLIRGIGNLELFKKNTDALYMPEFASNLLSVQKATKDLDCLAVFSPDDVWFQDNKSGEY